MTLIPHPYGLMQGAAGATGPQFRSASFLLTSGNGERIVPKPTGLAVGDLMVMVCICRNNPFTGPDGGTGWDLVAEWDVLTSSISTPVTGNDFFQVWERVADAGDVAGSGFSITLTDQGTDAVIVSCSAIPNATGVVAISASASGPCPSVNASEGDILFMYNGTVFDTSQPSLPSPPGSQVEVVAEYNVGTDTGLYIFRETLTADGATGTRTWTNPFDAFDIHGLIAIGNP